MPKRRANGEGNIRKRKDGRWEGRYTVGHDPETGKSIIKNVLGKTQAEVKEKLKKAIEENVGIDYGRAKTYTVGSWLEVWMENYAKVKLRPSTFKTSQGFLKNHIKPQIGGIPLADLTSLDLQRFYKHLLDGGRVDRIEAKKKPKGLAPKTVRNIGKTKVGFFDPFCVDSCIPIKLYFADVLSQFFVGEPSGKGEASSGRHIRGPVSYTHLIPQTAAGPFI